MNNFIMFTGGGTGGHVYPNIAIADEMKKMGCTPLYMGSENGIERSIAKDNDIPFYKTKTIKFVRGLSLHAILNNINIPTTLYRAVNEAKEILLDTQPDLIFSKGGFASLPCVIAASRMNIPIIAHESDKTLGIANRIAKLLGATILKANPYSNFDGILVGMPLRRHLFEVSRLNAYKKLHINTTKPVLLVIGGSSGASAINDEIYNHLKGLCAHFFVLHIVGKNKSMNINHQDYISYEYADDIATFYASSDVVVSRAGATSIYELSALQKKALFVPLPKGISRGDQVDNANLALEYGGNLLLQDENFSCNFLPKILETYKNPPMSKIQSDSNGKIVKIICDTLRRGEKCKNRKPSPNGSQ